MARSSDFRSRRSPSQNSKSIPARCARGLALRTSARTEKPASARQRATAEPTKPLAPVTRTLSLPLMQLRQSVGRRTTDSAEEIRMSPSEQALSPILQSLDQAVGSARSDDRREFIAPRRKIAD